MIYLDNSATTALCPEAANAMQQVMGETYGNPSSLHAAGIAAEKIVAAARSDVLAALGVRGDGRQLVFCGSGADAFQERQSARLRCRARFQGGY